MTSYRLRWSASLFCIAWLTLVPTLAHVELDSPNGGEELQVGSTVVITWHVAVQHDLLDWDLWYSTTGSDPTSWTPIALDLPAGDPAEGSQHSHEWTIPDTLSRQVRVRVRQDNGGTDYNDTSDADLAIVSTRVDGRLHLLRLDTVRPDLTAVFGTLPCTRDSDLRICEQAPGDHESIDAPTVPLLVGDQGRLVLIELDSDLAAVGTVDRITLDRAPSGAITIFAD